MTDRRYVFAPLEQRGVVIGLRAGQVCCLAAGLVIGLMVVRNAPDAVGAFFAGLVIVAATAIAFVPVSGRPVEQWAPTVIVSSLRRAGGAHRRRPTADQPVPAVAPLRGLRVQDVADAGQRPVGLVSDRAGPTLTVVLGVRGRSFALLDAEDKERRLASWSSVLSGLSREGSHIRSIQWVERTVPGDSDALRRHVASARVLAPEAAASRSYAELIDAAGPLGQEHECFVALSIKLRQGRRRSGAEVALREARLLEGQLRAADLDVDHLLSAREIGAVLRVAFDPWARTDLGRRASVDPDRSGCDPALAGPAAADEGWAHWRTDEVWHATFWVAEWPRRDVGPDFLTPLLLQSGAQRAMSVVMAPLPPAAGMREAEAARTAQAADDQLRQRAGFLATARRRRDAEGIARREAELSDGHVAYRFSGYVTVSARSSEGLEEACAETVQVAHQCRLELRRLYGVQEAAFAWTLPIGRGVASR